MLSPLGATGGGVAGTTGCHLSRGDLRLTLDLSSVSNFQIQSRCANLAVTGDCVAATSTQCVADLCITKELLRNIAEFVTYIVTEFSIALSHLLCCRVVSSGLWYLISLLSSEVAPLSFPLWNVVYLQSNRAM